jgi:hypothetical protein
VKRLITSMLLASAATVAALSMGGTAMAAQPCWQQLINDWYDGRIDRVYPVDCYRQALIHMPEDVAQYSSMRDDISRALQAAIAAGGGGGTSGSSGGGSTPSGGGQSSTFHGGPKAGLVLAASANGRDQGGGPLGHALGSLGSDSADAVPLPLIILGSLSILLLALGSAGFVARRVQSRKPRPQPSTKG